MSDWLEGFVRQSNAIEGITRDPRHAEVGAHINLLSSPALTVALMREFVGVIQPGAKLRENPGMDVRVGSHVAPPGGPTIRDNLDELLFHCSEQDLTPWDAHLEYETLHPFIDGNGRSGRAIWLWMMEDQGKPTHYPLYFLQAFYYQTLSESR